jgi:hypothetical protein
VNGIPIRYRGIRTLPYPDFKAFHGSLLDCPVIAFGLADPEAAGGIMIHRPVTQLPRTPVENKEKRDWIRGEEGKLAQEITIWVWKAAPKRKAIIGKETSSLPSENRCIKTRYQHPPGL